VFNSFSVPAQSQVLAFEAVRLTTGLEWIQVDLDTPQLPQAPGVYAWVDAAAPNGLRYHGNGSGKGGLHRRLTDQLRWRANQRHRLGVDERSLTEQDAYDLAREVPAVQQAAGDRHLHYAIAEPASWSIDRSDIVPPREAREWESFISAVSLLVTGHRGLVGGGAWESKAGTIDQLMTDLAWDRLVDVSGGGWL